MQFVSCETKSLCSIFDGDVEEFLKIFERLVFCRDCKTEETRFRYWEVDAIVEFYQQVSVSRWQDVSADPETT